jgi:protein SCO1/2
MDRKNILFGVLVALLLVAIGVYEYTLPPTLHGAIIDPPKQMNNFNLSGANGPVSLSDFHGKLAVVFFGFTHCDDICPLTLAKLNDALTRLGSQSTQVNVIFISVDYKRDTPQISGAYASKFRPEFVGLSGSQAEIDAVTKDFGIAYSLGEPDASGSYEVQHTATLLLLDQQGRLLMTWTTDQQPDEIASDLGVILGK